MNVGKAITLDNRGFPYLCFFPLCAFSLSTWESLTERAEQKDRITFFPAFLGFLGGSFPTSSAFSSRFSVARFFFRLLTLPFLSGSSPRLRARKSKV